MKVVLIGASFPLDDTHVRALAERVDLTLYGHTRQLRKQEAGPMGPPSTCKSRSLRPFTLVPRGPMLWVYSGLAGALERDAPDLVHVLLEPWKLVAVQAARWARRHPETAFVVQCGERNWFRNSLLERTGRRFFARRTLELTDAFVGSNAKCLVEAEESGLLERATTACVAYNPRDPAVFRPAAEEDERRACRRRLGLPEEGIGIGFVTRLAPEKGPLLYLEALRAARLGDGAWGAIAGAGPQEEEVGRRARGQGVRFLGRLDYPGGVADFLRAIDVVVFPSRRIGRWEEQVSRGVVEAMMSGCVVVATRAGALPEVVGDAGILVEEDDPAALTRAIERGAAEAFRPDLGRRARGQAVERYSGEALADGLVEVWNEVLTHTRTGSPRVSAAGA